MEGRQRDPQCRAKVREAGTARGARLGHPGASIPHPRPKRSSAWCGCPVPRGQALSVKTTSLSLLPALHCHSLDYDSELFLSEHML